MWWDETQVFKKSDISEHTQNAKNKFAKDSDVIGAFNIHMLKQLFAMCPKAKLFYVCYKDEMLPSLVTDTKMVYYCCPTVRKEIEELVKDDC
jgi:hypothetical protein